MRLLKGSKSRVKYICRRRVKNLEMLRINSGVKFKMLSNNIRKWGWQEGNLEIQAGLQQRGAKV